MLNKTFRLRGKPLQRLVNITENFTNEKANQMLSASKAEIKQQPPEQNDEAQQSLPEER